MCGIAGLVTTGAGDPLAGRAAVLRMVAALRHRGPDDEGLEGVGHNGSVWLANTRLAIQDPSAAGHQPMTDPETGNWIVLNGEIYNHLLLREQLTRRWQSGSDTETLLAAYARWGKSCLDRLRGMFAFAIWDAGAQRLWCARDRLGIKPFYYHQGDRSFLFASEVRALLASGLIPARLDRRGLAGYLRYGSLPDPLTLVDGVRALPAGQWLALDTDLSITRQTYWQPTRISVGPRNDGQLGSRLRESLSRAVGEHLLADVPVATFLSGGIDSALVTAIAATVKQDPLQSFTLGFADAALDESEQAAVVAGQYGTDHTRILLSADEVSTQVQAAVRAMDQPSIDGINTYLVAGAVAAAGVKVVLSGLGGDELFGGYPSFWDLPWAHRRAPLLGLLPHWLRARLAGGGPKGARAAEMTRRGLPYHERYASLRALWPLAELLRADQATDIPLGEDAAGFSLSTRSSLLELTGYMRSVLLRDADAMSMAHGLELRVPFLDHELVTLCLSSDTASPSRRGRPKPLLVSALGDLLPAGLAERPKQGFILPWQDWIAGPLASFVRSGREALAAHDPFPLDPAALLPPMASWQLAVLGHWLEAHLPAR